VRSLDTKGALAELAFALLPHLKMRHTDTELNPKTFLVQPHYDLPQKPPRMSSRMYISLIGRGPQTCHQTRTHLDQCISKFIFGGRLKQSWIQSLHCLFLYGKRSWS
jgi:hypothetical protein